MVSDEDLEYLDYHIDEKLEIEVLRCWCKIQGRIVIKTKVFEAKSEPRITNNMSKG